jgi:hypothetical protein
VFLGVSSTRKKQQGQAGRAGPHGVKTGMTPSDEKLLEMAAQLAAGDQQFYAAMQRRCMNRPDADELALPTKLLLEHFCVVREAAALIEAGVIAKLPYDPAAAKKLEWSPS